MDNTLNSPNSLNTPNSPTTANTTQPVNNTRNSSGIGPVHCRDLFDGTGRFFSAAEIEFMAENCLVSIKPRRKMEEIDLISGKFGPFRPNKIENVPLWMAVVLRKGNHCELVPPPWLNKSFLENVLAMEYQRTDEYQALPEHYLEISLLLLECGSADIPESEHVRKLVQCLREVRHQKTLDGLKLIDGDPLKLQNISRMELNEIRPFLLPSMDKLAALRRAKLEERMPSSNTQ